jgi:hypothetical protein
LQSMWMKTADTGARLGENGERRDTLVYALRLEDAAALFQAVAQTDPITVGVKRWGERSDTVYSGRPHMPQDARERLAACLDAIAG